MREHFTHILVASAPLILVVGAAGPLAAVAATLPVPCASGTCGAAGPLTWVSQGAASAVSSGNQLTISQTSNQAILNWSSFNVSADGKVVFQQPGSTSIALNRIFQGSPSTIFGTIDANGQVYLINPNGLIFGPTASVNASGILASTLNISDSAFQNGLLSAAVIQSEQPQLASDGRAGVVDNSGNPVLGADGKQLPVQLTVQQGAALTTSGSGGRILLAGPTVTNSGSLTSQNGQVILAAGNQVFLAPSSDPALRGLLVEVDQGGKAWNTLTGNVSTPEGNVSLVGLIVNQDGRISATTSVAANGSVDLLAQDTVQIALNGASSTLSATRGGTLTLGPASSLTILPDATDTTTEVAAQPQLQSTINLSGQQIELQGGSQIVAPSGQLTATASADPSNLIVSSSFDPNARLRIDSGALVDLSGSVATLPMSANQLTVQLNAAELANDPQQRTGFLHGQNVTVDIRSDNGTGTTVADVTSDIAAIPQTVLQRTESGGSATFVSTGDLAAASGATINVSGGHTQYQSGYIATSQLIEANGKTVDITNADPSQTYIGIVNPGYTVKYNNWGVIQTVPNTYLGQYEQGYEQGAAAGTIQLAGRSMVVDANLMGATVAGPYQRTGATTPTGGQLIIGLPSPLANPPNGVDYLAPAVTFVTAAPPVSISDSSSLPPGLTLDLPTGYLANGFTKTIIYSNGSISIPASTPIAMQPGSTLSLFGNDISIDSNISSAGGTLSFNSIITDGVNGATEPSPGISIGAGVVLDVRGNWTNDQVLAPSVVPTSLVDVNGGSITALLNNPSASLLSVGADAAFELSGGAWLQRNGSIQYGSGGSLTLASHGIIGNQFLIGPGVGLDAFGVGTAPGGSLSLDVDQFVVASLPTAAGWELGVTSGSQALTVGTSLFSGYGFASVSLTADGMPTPGVTNIATVAPGTVVNAVSSSLVLNPGYQFQANADDALRLGDIQELPLAQRTPMSVTLDASPSTYSGTLQSSGLDLPPGATLSGDPGSRFTLSATGGLDIAGSIDAPAGTINLQVLSPVRGDPGFVPGLGLTLEPTAVLNAAGTTVLQPGNPSFPQGQVLPGGAVSLIADRGSVNVLPGAMVEIGGGSGVLEAPAPSGIGENPTPVASAGGSLFVQAPNAINWLGTLMAAAGQGGADKVNAGSVTVVLDPSSNSGPGFPVGTRTIDVISGAASLTSFGNTQAEIGTQLLASGIDKLVLESNSGVIEFDPGVDLNLARELDLIAPKITVTGSTGIASVSAPYVQIAYDLGLNRTVPQTGGATLNIAGNLIDLVGATAFSGISTLSLSSAGDIRLTSINQSGTNYGSLETAGNLMLGAERIYPATQTAYTISTLAPLSAIDIAQTGPSPGDPFSVAAAVSFSAPVIMDSGTVLAPFGTITMNASQSLTLANSSLTSVAGNQNLYLYGTVVDGTWGYNSPSGAFETLTSTPNRQVSLQAPILAIDKGATIDISGGGDLFSYEWTPGTGGTKDLLNQSISPNLYAILPGLPGQVAPLDPALQGTSLPSVGEDVYLSGVPGLAAGTYALLPARYGLLPGAYLVSPEANSSGRAANVVTTAPDGGTVVTGYYVTPGTTLTSAQGLGFEVQPGSYSYKLADYTPYTATSYLTALGQTTSASVTTGPAAVPVLLPTLPATAGALALSVTESLSTAGSVLTAPAAGGEGGLIEFSMPTLEVSGAAQTNGLAISSQILQAWDPARLILGGTLSPDGSTLTVTAADVTVDAAASLKLPDITLLASGNILVQPGANLSTPATTGELPLTPTSVVLAGAPGAALLEISSISYEVPTRTTATAANGGTISLAAASSIEASGALVIDAPQGASLDGALTGAGARWSLGAQTIDFASIDSPGALTVTPAVQTALEGGSALRLTANTIQIDSPLNLGTTSNGLSLLTLNTNSIQSGVDAGDSSLAAQTIVLGDTFNGTATAPGPPPGAGSLALSAQQITLGTGTASLNGFGQVNLTASGDLTFSGTGGLAVSGDLNITANRVLAASNATGSVTASGALDLLPSGASATQGGPVPVGGAIDLQGQTVNVSGTVLIPSGNLTIGAAQTLTVGSGAVLNTAGTTVTAAGTSQGSPGGTILLTSGGTLSAATGATLEVGASANNAGSIDIHSAGAAQLDATFLGHGGTGYRGGNFGATVGTLDSFQALETTLESGGFSGARSVAVAAGNLILGSGENLTANHVSLVAETGSVQVNGTISSPPSSGSSSAIALYGAEGVTVSATGRVNADAVANGALGGSISIGTSQGSIDLQPGSVISARGNNQSGSLTLIAPASANDVSITELGADTSGLSQVIVAPLSTFTVAPNPTQSDFATILSQVTAYSAVATPQIQSRLQNAGAPVVVDPAIDIEATGNLNLSSIDLGNWRFGGQAGIVSFRASGNVNVNGTISDGFTSGINASGTPDIVPVAGPSSTIQIIAGANLSSPNPLGVNTGATANLTLGPGSVVNTGTGAIELAAAQDVVFQHGSSVYTGGTPVAGVAPIPIGDWGTANFLSGGGNIGITAGRDVVGASVVGSPADWNIRALADYNPNAGGGGFWGPDPTLFNWNVGTLGGGNVSVIAGRDISNLSAAAADSAIVSDVTSTSLGTLANYGGGSLGITAGRNINTGYFYVADGSGLINAGGSVASAPAMVLGAPVNLGTMLIVGSAQVQVDARQDVNIEGAINPTTIGEPASPEPFAFFSFGNASSLQLQSSGGSVYLGDGKALGFLGLPVLLAQAQATTAVFPSSLQVRAYGGNIDLTQVSTLDLFPSATGQLNLFAAGNLSGGYVVMSDASLNAVPNIFSATTTFSGVPSSLASAALDAIHQANPTAASISVGGNLQGTTFRMATPVALSVGENMVDANLTAQNLQATDATTIDVAGAISYDLKDLQGGISVGGPGSLWVAAAGPVNLGFASGIVTTGRLDDPNIPVATGANITVLAGLGSQGQDLSGFLSKVVEPSTTYAADLISYVTPAGATATASPSQAVTAFEALSPVAQGQFIDSIFFQELVEAGRLANSQPGSNFARGYAAIDALFPGSRSTSSPYSGDLTLDFSRIYTLAGGDISLLVPGGSLNVGLAVPPEGVNVQRSPSQLGIVAEQTGSVDIYSYGNVLVNSSRIFTLGGGDIAIWSTTENIDAGRGAKSSVSAPPPVVQVDSQGNITLDFSGAVAGSGIRTIITQPGQSPGNVDLIAPVGYVNAGDAGIGASGNLSIAAQYVLNAQNISVGGVAVGVPPQVGGLSASLSGATSTASSTTNASTSAGATVASSGSQTPMAQSAISWLDVFILGLGEENCSANDVDCLKRQKPSTAP